MSYLWYGLLLVDTINPFLKIKKHRGTPGERDPFLGPLDQQAVDEVPCRSAGYRRPTTVGGEP
jgi:hypothetical protein